jgi:2-phosphoglycerate kinase
MARRRRHFLDSPPGNSVRVILLGGPSNVGKSTAARSLAARLGWTYRSTDGLARHPGRPWLPDGSPLQAAHVIDHYRTHSVPELSDAVIAHYTRMWPAIAELIQAHAAGDEPLVLEGSALWPDTVATLKTPGVAALWLTAPAELLRRRMHAASGYEQLPADRRELVDKFLGRALRCQDRMTQALTRLGLTSLDVGGQPATDEALQRLLSAQTGDCRDPDAGHRAEPGNDR